MTYQHPFIQEGAVEEREYQINIAQAVERDSTLVVLPTGMGKTIIALLVIAKVYEKRPDGKVLFLAPTKPLVSQHASDLEEILDIEDIGKKTEVFTGEVRPDKREELWDEKKFIVSTPQVIRNDLMSQRIDLNDLSLLIFDEAHRAVGDYAYVYIGERYREVNPEGMSLGLTASPGSETEDILSVCEKLGFEHVEIRTKYDPDVVKYTNYLQKKWIDVQLSKEQRAIVNKLKSISKQNIEQLQKIGFLQRKNPKRVNRKKLIETRERIQKEIHSDSSEINKSKLFKAASLVASAIKIDHAVDQAETQGLDSLREYLDKLKNEADSRGGTKASKRLMKAPEMKDVLVKLKKTDQEHPKVQKVIDVLKDQRDMKEDFRAIVFTNYRSTSQIVKDRLENIEGLRPVRFIGQTDKQGDKGLKQKEQVNTLEEFESGTYNVLVATSVGEEGLDIPATDLVVFYEPVPSEIRTIQRRGRTARKREGKVVILITKDTRDEAYYWSSKRREKKMHKNLMALRDDLESEISVGDPMKRGKKEVSEGEDDVDKKGYKVVGKKSKKDLKRKQERSERKKSRNQRSLSDFDRKEEEEKEEEGEKGEDEEEKGSKGEITVDTREQNSQVVQEISREDIKINTSQLSIGDYIVSEETAVERKSVDDFLESLMDGRLFSQVRSLSESYQHPVMILEGQDLFERRNIDDNAIYGALTSLACDFRLSILPSEDGKETARLLSSMVKREAKDKSSTATRTRKDKRSMSTMETKKFILEGLPSVSGTLADRLLDHFGSVRAVFTADKEELEEVKGIGPSTAEKILSVIE